MSDGGNSEEQQTGPAPGDPPPSHATPSYATPSYATPGYPPPGYPPPGYPPPGYQQPGPGYLPQGYGYGYGPPPPPPGFPPIPAGVDPTFKDKKLAAGLCGVLIGQFGVHKFVLGYRNEGVIMAVCAGVGWLLFFLGSLLSVVMVGLFLLPFVVLPIGTSIIGLIEGILYLTKSDYDFVMTYGVNRKAWF